MFRFDGVDSGSTRRADLVDVVGRIWSDCDRYVGVVLVSCRRRSGVLAGVAPVSCRCRLIPDRECRAALELVLDVRR